MDFSVAKTEHKIWNGEISAIERVLKNGACGMVPFNTDKVLSKVTPGHDNAHDLEPSI